MFCRECGSQLADGAVFCTNCGAPVAPEQQAFANTVPEAEAPVQQAYANTVPEPEAPVQQAYANAYPEPEAPVQPAYANAYPEPEAPVQPAYANAYPEPEAPVQQAYANTVPDMNVMQQDPAGATPPVYGQAPYGEAPQAYESAGGQKPAMDKKRVILEILFSVLRGAVILPAVFLLLLWLLSRPWSVDFLRSIQQVDEMPSVLLIVLICVVSALLSIVPKVITIMARYKNPSDPAYKVGAAPDVVMGAKTERKHNRIGNIFAYLTIVLTFVFAGCVIYFLADLPDVSDNSRDRDSDRTPSSSSSVSSPASDSLSSSDTSEPDSSSSSDRSDSSGTPDSSSTPDNSSASGGLTATGDIGRTLSTMFFDCTVVSAESPSEYYGYTAQSGNKLLVVSVKVKNDFGSTLPMYDTDFQIVWGWGDYDYAWAVDAFNDRMMPLEWEIVDGDEITWDMLFEVPAGQYDFSLVYLEEYTDANGDDQTGDLYSANFTLPAASSAN